MSFVCILKTSDYKAFRRHMMFKRQKIHWIYGGMFLIFLGIIWFGGRPDETKTDKIYLLIGSAIFFGVALFAITALMKLFNRVVGSGFTGTTGEHEFEVFDNRITEKSIGSKIETRLEGIKFIDETQNHLFLITHTGLGHVIPKRDLKNDDQLCALRSLLVGKPT